MSVTAEVFGDYLLKKEGGKRDFGSVFLAEHRLLKQEVLLKILPKELSENSEFIKNFEENIGLYAKLNHPNIVKIHNVSCFDGNYFIVSDPILPSYKNTFTLRKYLEEKKVLSEKEVVSIAGQIASALDYAHQNPMHDNYVFHGGINMDNILVKKKNEEIQVYLSDFGMQQILGHFISYMNICKKISGSLYTTLLPSTEQEQFLENYFINYAFIAPEHKSFYGEKKDLIKVDSYAFGVLLYFLLTQTLPEGYFPMPSSLRYDLVHDWDNFLQNLLQKNPENRASKLLEAGKDFLQEQTFYTKTDTPAEDKMQLSFIFTDKGKVCTSSNNVHPELGDLKPIIKPQEIKRPTYEPDPGAIFQREMQVSHYEPKKVEFKEVVPILTEMVVIPGGNYSRGCANGARDEMPRHNVVILSYALDIHPVTNEQFVRFLQAMGGEKDENNNDIIRLRDSRIKRSSGKLIIESGYIKHPVVGVTWYGALAYAKWIGKRLPTEAEWEIAAANGKDYIYPSGESIERSQANYFSADTTAVLSYPPNEFGLYDMVGNVYEWCNDWYAYNYYDVSMLEPESPMGPQQGVYRVLRGGCWKSLKEDLRISHRHRNNPGAVNRTYGFRCAADVSE